MKEIPSDERWYGNSKTRERNDENWKRRRVETDKEQIGNLEVGVYDIREISGTEMGKYDTSS